jgi:hypothetical protein
MNEIDCQADALSTPVAGPHHPPSGALWTDFDHFHGLEHCSGAV